MESSNQKYVSAALGRRRRCPDPPSSMLGHEGSTLEDEPLTVKLVDESLGVRETWTALFEELGGGEMLARANDGPDDEADARNESIRFEDAARIYVPRERERQHVGVLRRLT